MPRKIIDTSKINQTRLQYINKGYLTCSEVAKFVPCGSTKASRIYHQIRNQVEAEGLENCFNVILVNRLLDFMGLTAKEIKEAAKREASYKGRKMMEKIFMYFLAFLSLVLSLVGCNFYSENKRKKARICWACSYPIALYILINAFINIFG